MFSFIDGCCSCFTKGYCSYFTKVQKNWPSCGVLSVFNISRAGLGFTTTAVIPLDYYFNATIEFEGTDDCLKYVVKIIRTKEIENGMHEYGCEFVGFASIYDSIFDKYEKKFANYEE